MSKYLLITFFAIMMTASVSAQSLVSTEPANRIAVLEEFTGINCTWCPEGHAIAQGLKATYGEGVQLMNIHAGSFANTTPDFRSEFADELADNFVVTGYPSGAVNRIMVNGVLALDRGSWAGAVEEVSKMASPVNLGLASSFDAETRELTVTVELYYTGDAEGEMNSLHVNLVENKIIAPQIDQGVTIPDYEHNHMLRTQITGMLGETFETGEQFITKTYTYEVPEDYVIENCEVLAYVSETAANIYTGRTVDAIGGTTLVVADVDALSEIRHLNTALTEGLTVDYTSTNLLPGDESFTVSLVAEGAPEEWTNNLIINGVEQTENTVNINMSNGVENTISIDVTPCTNAGLGTYTITIASDANPAAPVLTETFYVMSGIRDLVISNPEALEFEAGYTDLLGLTEKTEMAAMSPVNFAQFKEANATGEIENIYYNIGWTFPAFTDNMADQLTSYLDNGGNLFMAGQDIGWAVNDVANGPYQTETNIAFYTDYMHANYTDDGSPSDTEANFTTEDEWFGGIGTTNIIDVYGGGNQYPEHFEPLGDAVAIMTLGNGDVGGLRVETENYKLVYLGINLEQMEDQEVATAIVQATHDWFYDGVEINTEDLDCPPPVADGVETIEGLNTLLGQNYPNPADQIAVVEFTELSEKATFQLFDFNGRLMMEENLAPFTKQITLNTAKLAPGFYSYRLQTAEGVSEGRKMQVIH